MGVPNRLYVGCVGSSHRLELILLNVALPAFPGGLGNRGLGNKLLLVVSLVLASLILSEMDGVSFLRAGPPSKEESPANKLEGTKAVLDD